jgi:peptide subunit release factor 1 (eRF1)
MITTEDLDRIIRLDGNGLPIVSLYVRNPADPGGRAGLQTHVHGLLDEVRDLAKDKSADHDLRMSLRGDVDRIEAAFRENRFRPGSVALFSCSGRGVSEEVQLPRAVHERVLLDETPYIRPMLAVLEEYRRCCVIIIDAAVTEVWELHLDELRRVGAVRDPVLRKPDYAAGLKEHNVHHRARELEKRHYRRTVTMLNDLVRATRYDVLAVGGHPHEVPGFVEFLPQELRVKVAGTFQVDPDTASRADIKEQAAAILERYERDEEKRLIAQALDKAAAGGLAAVGVAPVLWAGSVAAVDRLLVQEGATIPGVICDESGWLGSSGETCPLCGEPVRQTPDILDELVQVVIDEGGSIEHVESDTDLKEHLVAAELRFPLPPEPAR